MDLQQEIKTLKERISESEKLLSKLEEQIKKEQEFPLDGDEYWYIHMTGDIYNENWEVLGVEITMLEMGNVFRTKEQAEFALEKLKVEAELRKFSRPFEIYGTNYHLYFAKDNGFMGIGYTTTSLLQGAIYFESKEKAQQAIQAVGEERIKKYIFGVED